LHWRWWKRGRPLRAQADSDSRASAVMDLFGGRDVFGCARVRDRSFARSVGRTPPPRGTRGKRPPWPYWDSHFCLARDVADAVVVVLRAPAAATLLGMAPSRALEHCIDIPSEKLLKAYKKPSPNRVRITTPLQHPVHRSCMVVVRTVSSPGASSEGRASVLNGFSCAIVRTWGGWARMAVGKSFRSPKGHVMRSERSHSQ
jgi:hypothetical protein